MEGGIGYGMGFAPGVWSTMNRCKFASFMAWKERKKEKAILIYVYNFTSYFNHHIKIFINRLMMIS
jgi:hypothetical protein